MRFVAQTASARRPHEAQRSACRPMRLDLKAETVCPVSGVSLGPLNEVYGREADLLELPRKGRLPPSAIVATSASRPLGVKRRARRGPWARRPGTRRARQSAPAPTSSLSPFTMGSATLEPADEGYSPIVRWEGVGDGVSASTARRAIRCHTWTARESSRRPPPAWR